MTRRAFPLVLAGITLTVLACGRGTPGPTASSATASPGSRPTPSPTASPPIRPSAGLVPTRTGAAGPSPPDRPLGDLSIALAGGCTWYVDSTGGLWLEPTLRAFWTGPTAFPANGFSMTATYGTKTAGGPVVSSVPFTWAIGGEPAAGNEFLGRPVRLTVTIDPVNGVPETNETNNVTIIEVTVPTSGYGTFEAPLACSML